MRLRGGSGEAKARWRVPPTKYFVLRNEVPKILTRHGPKAWRIWCHRVPLDPFKDGSGLEPKWLRTPGLWPMACQTTQPVLWIYPPIVPPRHPKIRFPRRRRCIKPLFMRLKTFIPFHSPSDTVLGTILVRFWIKI